VQILYINDINDATAKDERRFIGWRDTEYLYLLPGPVYRQVQLFLRDQGRDIGVTDKMLLKHLEADGYLETVESAGKYERVRVKKVNGENRRVLFLWTNKIFL
jgi:hypothetical protein